MALTFMGIKHSPIHPLLTYSFMYVRSMYRAPAVCSLKREADGDLSSLDAGGAGEAATFQKQWFRDGKGTAAGVRGLGSGSFPP